MLYGRRLGTMVAPMTEPIAAARILTQGRELGGRSTPRAFSRPAWYRFSRDRRRRYVSRIAGEPTDTQSALVQTLVALEWSALKHEAAGTLAADKVALDARRLFGRFLGDFERSLVKPTASQRAPSLAEVLAAREMT
jgi:hypothetical protein